MVQKIVVLPQLQFGQGCAADHRDSPVARGQGGRCPCMQVVQVSQVDVVPFVAQRQIPIDHRGSPVAVRIVVDVPFVLVGRVPQVHVMEAVVLPQLQLVEQIVAIRRGRHHCRDAEPVSHSPASLVDRRDTPVAVH